MALNIMRATINLQKNVCRSWGMQFLSTATVVNPKAESPTPTPELTADNLKNVNKTAAGAASTSEKLSADTAKEVDHHASYATDWWNANGALRGLHALNEIRVPFIRDGLISRGRIESSMINTSRVLQHQQILEVGCGGGILTEQLARLGATVIGIDLGEEVIRAASEHLAKHSPEIQGCVTYKVQSVEKHAIERSEYYDAVVLSEVLEHVSDKASLLTACVQTLKPGGSIFITSPNKTVPMWIGGVLLAEYVFNVTPKGTHHWDKLANPLEVQRILDTLNCSTVLLNGSIYNVFRNSWHWINSTSMCFALQAVKADT